MTDTYWNGKGKHQADYHRLWAKLVPAEGPASTRRGELLRAASSLYYDHYNNGGDNIRWGNLDGEIGTIREAGQLLPLKVEELLRSRRYNSVSHSDLEFLMDSVVEVVAKADRELEGFKCNPELAWEFLNTRWI